MRCKKKKKKNNFYFLKIKKKKKKKKKKKNTVIFYLISLSERVSFMEVWGTFLSSGYVLRHVQSFKGFG